ncbi:hypothetical protein D9613_005699 [Agrocybe pediades]|uniref:Uncharacterized protein n=1 Tax=Agrocybe pediades TaxID=84607 RepID=A0A8H4QVS0_9AGAR|nr:hypothetical protein D9613_005699 [Agrocybe pediades]
MFSALKRMPQLRRLRIYREYSNTVTHYMGNLVSVHLPQLQSLQLFGPQTELHPFLELIKPSPVCSIMVSSTNLPSPPPPGNNQDSHDGVQAPLSRFYRALFPWILAYMKGRAPRNISLQADVFEPFRMCDYSSYTSASGMPNLEEELLEIEFALDSYCRSTIAELGTLSESFSSVKQLTVCIVDKHDALVPIYKAFTSVTKLTLEAYLALDLVALHAHKEQSILFPQLHSLCVMLLGKALSDSVVPKIVLDIVDFVENRAGVGLPLSCLDFLVVDRRITISDNDKERLQELPGLTIKFMSS